MPYRTLDEIVSAGFVGFRAIAHLRATDLREIPDKRGVYMVLRQSTNPPQFRPRSSAGFFKGRDPTVDINVLTNKWIAASAVLYVGKAGGTNKKTGEKISSTLRSRLQLYLDYGAGKPVGHQGGRYIWQLEGAEELVICWMETPGEDPVDVEQRLIDQSCAVFDQKYPFANCRR